MPSPTFTLVQIYEGLGPDAADLFHFDLYRIDAPEDALELGIEDAFAGGIAVIEWPDRLGPFLPARRLDLVFADVPGRANARQLRLERRRLLARTAGRGRTCLSGRRRSRRSWTRTAGAPRSCGRWRATPPSAAIAGWFAARAGRC